MQLNISIAGALPPPDFTASDTMPLDGLLAAFYPAGYQVQSFNWQISLLEPAAATQNGADSASLTQTPPATLSEPLGRAHLATFHLTPGSYLVQVSATLTNGRRSPAAHATVNVIAGSAAALGRVYPNPWRADRHANRDITFDQLAPGSTIKIFTVSAHWVATLTASSTGAVTWNRTNDSGDQVASGLYLYLVTDPAGNQAHGKIAVIK